MIKAEDAIAKARELIGTPYGTGAGQLDCINLVKKIIRECPGGVKGYTTAGTNALWNSFTMSKKYKDLTMRERGIQGVRGGMLVFKQSGEDVHHVGLATTEGTVIHASSAKGSVVETKLTTSDGWNLMATHRYISTKEAETEKKGKGTYTVCARGGLRMRKKPGGEYMQMIPDGARIEIESISGEWGKTTWRGYAGWVSMDYLCYADGND